MSSPTIDQRTTPRSLLTTPSARLALSGVVGQGRIHSASFVEHLSKLGLSSSARVVPDNDSPTQPAASSIHQDTPADELAEPNDTESTESDDEQTPTSDAEASSAEAPGASDTPDDAEPQPAPEVIRDAAPLTIQRLNTLLLTGHAPASSMPRETSVKAGTPSHDTDADADAKTEHESTQTESSAASERDTRSSKSASLPRAQDSARPRDADASERANNAASDNASKHDAPAPRSTVEADPRGLGSLLPKSQPNPSLTAQAAAPAVAVQNTANKPTADAAANSKGKIQEQAPGSLAGASAVSGKNAAASGKQSSADNKDSGAFPSQSGASSTPSRASSAEAALNAQVTRGVLAAVNQRGGSVTIRLTPEHLGPMRVHVKLKDGAISARFEASSDSARDLLSSSLDMLKASLEDRGYVVENLHVQAAEPHTSTPTFGQLREHEGRTAYGGDGSSEHGRSSDSPSHDADADARQQLDGGGRMDGGPGGGARLGDDAAGFGDGPPYPLTEWSRVEFKSPISHTAEPMSRSIDALA